MTKRVLVVLVIMLALAQRQGLAQAVRAIDGAVVVDATGRKIAALQETNRVFFELPDKAVAVLQVRAEGFSNLVATHFATTDCSGTPYGVPPPGMIQTGIIGPPGNTLYRPDPNASPQSIAGGSSRLSLGTPCFPGGSAIDLVPLVPVVDLDTLFTPPFRLIAGGPQAAIQCCGDCNGDGDVTINEIITGVNSALSGCPTP